MSEGRVLAIDQGTTGSRALLLDRRGVVRGRGYAELPQHFPHPGWVEHDGEEIWASVAAAVAAALRSEPGRRGSARIEAIGITNQRETTLLWSRRTGRPVARAIVWQDRRTSARCAELKHAGFEAEARRRTGLVLDPYFSATKLEWLLRHPRALAGRANLERRRWDQVLLGRFGVPATLLPEVRPSSGSFGTTHGVGFLADGIPVAGIAGDQQAALFGQGCVATGQGKNTYGTGCFLLVHTGSNPVRSRAGLLTTVACGPRGEPAYALEGSVFIAGAAIQWLRDGLGLLARAGDSEALAASVPDTGGVVMVPAFVGLGAPYWRPDVRGALLGLTRGTTRAHVVRAALESLAFQSRDLVEAMDRDARASGGRRGRVRVLKVDGGAAANDFLMQYQADLLGLPVQRPRVIETTALGAGLLAGLATGFWSSPAELARARRGGRTFRPRRPRAWREAEYRRWRNAVETLIGKR